MKASKYYYSTLNYKFTQAREFCSEPCTNKMKLDGIQINKLTSLFLDPKTELMIHRSRQQHLHHEDPMLHQKDSAAYQQTPVTGPRIFNKT